MIYNYYNQKVLFHMTLLHTNSVWLLYANWIMDDKADIFNTQLS